MKYFIFVFLLFSHLAFSQELKVATANNQFAFEFYKLGIHGNDNLFFSPISLELALAMTSAGAQGNTLTQMTRVLNVSGDYHTEFKNLSEKLKSTDAVTLLIANHLWAPLGNVYKTQFSDQLKTNYQIQISFLDFKNKIEEARTAINRWASSNTNDKIKNLIPSGVLDPRTEFVITDAIYFKGEWGQSFEKSQTKDALFRGANSEKTLIPFMNSTSTFLYAKDQDVSMLELAYKGKEIVMDVFLPSESQDPNAAGEKLTLAVFQKLLKIQTLRKVIVSVPKFKIESKLDLGEQLSKMGMPLAFDSQNADFGGMRDLKKMKESIYQK